MSYLNKWVRVRNNTIDESTTCIFVTNEEVDELHGHEFDEKQIFHFQEHNIVEVVEESEVDAAIAEEKIKKYKANRDKLEFKKYRQNLIAELAQNTAGKRIKKEKTKIINMMKGKKK